MVAAERSRNVSKSQASLGSDRTMVVSRVKGLHMSVVFACECFRVRSPSNVLLLAVVTLLNDDTSLASRYIAHETLCLIPNLT